MKKKNRAIGRVRVYLLDQKELRIRAIKKGVGIIPADIIHELLAAK